MSMTPEQRSVTAFDPIETARVLEAAVTQSGRKLLDLSAESPVLLVFLRHAGCTFCRETLADLSQHRKQIESNGTLIVIVHMGEPEVMSRLLERTGLLELDRIVDGGQDLYRAFGLKRGTLRQLFGLTVLNRAFLGGALARYGIGPLEGDSAQMPGLFVIYQGSIIRRFRHRSVADRPDYPLLARPLS
jgi:peroxiredoxin